MRNKRCSTLLDLKVKPATTLKESLGMNAVRVVGNVFGSNSPFLFNRDSIPPDYLCPRYRRLNAKKQSADTFTLNTKRKSLLASTLGGRHFICAYLRCLSQTLHKAEMMGYGDKKTTNSFVQKVPKLIADYLVALARVGFESEIG